MNISIPDTFQPVLQQKAIQAGFASAEEFAVQILLAELDSGADAEFDAWVREALAGDGVPADVPQAAVEKRKREIEALLIEGLESGPSVPMTAEDWADIRREVHER